MFMVMVNRPGCDIGRRLDVDSDAMASDIDDHAGLAKVEAVPIGEKSGSDNCQDQTERKGHCSLSGERVCG